MKKTCVALIVLATCLLAGCRSDVLFIASRDRDDPATKMILEAFQDTLYMESETGSRVDVHEIRAHIDKEPEMVVEFGELARLKALRTSAKVVVCVDDVAIREVARRLRNTSTQFVLCQMREDAEAYGVGASPHILGVLARTDLRGLTRLVRRVIPSAKRLGVLGDRSVLTAQVVQELASFSDSVAYMAAAETVSTEKGWMAGLRRLEKKVDAVVVAGMDGIVDSSGQPVPAARLGRMTASACGIPTVGVTRESVMDGGLLMAYAPSSRDQGRVAARYVARIFDKQPIEKITPKFSPVQGAVYVNVVLAEKLGVKIPKSVFRSAEGILKAAPKK